MYTDTHTNVFYSWNSKLPRLSSSTLPFYLILKLDKYLCTVSETRAGVTLGFWILGSRLHAFSCKLCCLLDKLCNEQHQSDSLIAHGAPGPETTLTVFNAEVDTSSSSWHAQELSWGPVTCLTHWRYRPHSVWVQAECDF